MLVIVKEKILTGTSVQNTMKYPNPNIFPKKELLIPEFQAYLSYPNTALYS